MTQCLQKSARKGLLPKRNNMEFREAKGLQLSQVMIFLSVVILSSLYQPTFSSRLPQPLPNLQNEQDFVEDLEIKVQQVSSSPGKLSPHGSESTAKATPKMHFIHQIDTTSESQVFPSTSASPEISTNNTESISPTNPAELPHMEDEYLKDLFSLESRRRGWVILHIIGMMYMFVSLAVVCNEFFIPAVLVITDMLAVSEDVAGATIMAAGRSAPKLFAVLIGVLIHHAEVGIGSIVGSALYNILFVIGVSALFSRKILHLNRWPVFRDASFYIFCLVLLIIFFLDNVVMWWESVMPVGCYTLYVTVMKFNAQIERVLKIQPQKLKRTIKPIPVEDLRKDAGESGSEEFPTEEDNSKNNSDDSSKNEADEMRVKEEEEEARENKLLSLKWPKARCEQVVFLLLLPVVVPLRLTLPDVRKQKSRRFCVITFLGSILWITVFTYLTLWWGHQVLQTFGIPDFLMVVLAGTVNADLLTSVIVARKDRADMAVSSSIGSNIFDITVGLSLPWLLYSSIYAAASVEVSNKGLVCAITLLFLMLIFAIIVIVACEWKMNKVLGSSLVLLYILFLVLSSLFQHGVILCPVSV